MMSTQQPPLQQRSGEISQRQQILANVGSFPNNSVGISMLRQSIVSVPTIGTNFASWLNAHFDRRYQDFSRCILNFMKTNSSRATTLIFNCHKHKRLSDSATATFPGVRSSNIGFINLDRSSQPVTIGTNHSCAYSVKHIPCCFIPVEPKNLLKAQGANPVLLTDHLPDGLKPQPQRNTRILEDSARCRGNPIAATFALVLSILSYPIFFVTTMRAYKPFSPPYFVKIFPASFFSYEAFRKLKHCIGKIFHGPYILHVGPIVVNRISIFLLFEF